MEVMDSVGEYVYARTNKAHGFYVDVGAYDGIFNDETIFLERLGWDGICIEGNPHAFAKLRGNRRAKLCNCYISGANEPRTVINLNVEYCGSAFTDKNNISKDHLEFLQRLDTASSICQCDARHLEDVLREYNAPNHIDLLKSDTEGACLEIIKSLSFSDYHYEYISLEIGEPDAGGLYEEAIAFLASKSYKLVTTFNQNDIFEHV